MLLGFGPKYVLVKKGEHGSLLVTQDSLFMMPAYPLEEVHDPTGAGDSFAGGFIGSLAAAPKITRKAIRQSMAYGSVVASFGVEAFSLDRLCTLTREQIEQRAALFREMMRL